MLKFFSALLLVSLFGLVIHSFTQVDHGLYLFSNSSFIAWQNAMVEFGLWSRLASGIWFTTFLGLGFVSYFYLLANWKSVSFLNIGVVVFGIGILSFLFFPAGLSHDIYNYIIYAKTLVTYHQNPLTVTPATFTNDPILPYVHWATSASRYGFVWVGISSLVYFVGQSSLLATFLAFKFLFLLFYFVIALLLSKFCDLLNLNKRKVFVFWFFNPYVGIEFLMSSHTDALVGVFLLMAMLLVLKGRYLKGWTAYLASVGVKIISIPLLVPIFLKQFFWLRTETFLKTSVLSAYFAAGIIISQWSINPWYFSIPILLSTLVIENRFYRYLALSLSVACELRYAPYFFMGYFDPSIKIRIQLFLLVLVPFGGWIIWGLINRMKKEKINSLTLRNFLQELQLV